MEKNNKKNANKIEVGCSAMCSVKQKRFGHIIDRVYVEERILEHYKNIVARVFASSVELEDVLSGFDIPDRRRDVANRSNLKWLLRNIAVRNATNPDLALAVKLIKDKLR